jgi:DNA primase
VSGRVSVALVEQVRQGSDIVDVVSSYVSLKRAGRALKGLCPFHNEKTPSFTVTAEKQIFHCFGCGAGGDVFKFIQLRENVDFREALTILASRAGISLEETPRQQAGDGAIPSKTDLERVNRWACRWFQQQLQKPSGTAAREYMASRGFSDESVDRFAIGYAPQSWDALCTAARSSNVPAELLSATGLARSREDGSRYDGFRNRLIFPIRDAMDRVIGFGGRTLGDDPAKYVNSPQNPLFDKSRCLYGIASAKHAFAKERCAVVVEGYVDCLMAQQHGFEHTVATLGTALTPEHVQMLRRYVDQVILLFDSDEAGQRAADNSLRLFLTERLDVRLARVPEAKDPADLLLAAGPSALQSVLTSAVDALEFKWNQIRHRYRDAATGPDRRRAIEEFLGLIAGIADLAACDPIQRGLILNQVGKLLGLPGEEVNRQLRIIARQTPGKPSAAAPARHAGRQEVGPAGLAMRELLEVLINDPGHHASVATEFDPRLLPDGDLREIATAVVELSRDQGGFTLPGLISRFESVGTASQIMELQLAGERKGNFAATVEGAAARLRELREERERSDVVAILRRGSDTATEPAQVESDSSDDSSVNDGDGQRSLLRAVSENRGGIGVFAGHRHSTAHGAAKTVPGEKRGAD